jgi:hypothetical protein
VCVAAEVQQVVLVEGPTFDAELVSIGDDGDVLLKRVAENPADEAASPGDVVRLRDIVRSGNPIGLKAQPIVVLADGSLIVAAADWSGGAAVRLEGDSFVVLANLLGEVTFARDEVRGVVFAQQRHGKEREELVRRVSKEESEDSEPSPAPSLKGRGNQKDVVFLSNGDRVRGELVALERGSLSIESGSGVVKAPLSRVEGVRVGSRPLSVVSRQLPYAVGLRDGSLIYAREVVANEKVLKITLGDGQVLTGDDVSDVVFLQSLDGRIVYLSDLEPADYRHVAYLTIDWPYERDRNVLGEPLVVNGERYLKGIGMHSAGRISYRLDGKFARFDASVAIDDSADGRGSVTFGVYLQRDGKLSEAFKSHIVRGGDVPVPVSVDVTGAQGLTLVVDYADRGDEMDRAGWLDARLVRAEAEVKPPFDKLRTQQAVEGAGSE